MKYEAVIFDWAGTTVDYGCFSPVQAFVDAFEAQQITPTLSEVREPMGMKKVDHIRTMLGMTRISSQWEKIYHRAWSEDDVHTIYKVFEERILKLIPSFSSVKPHVVETVETLREKGIKIGSTTGYTSQMMELVLPRARAEGYSPDAIVTPDAVGGHGRPYPYMIFRNCETLEVHGVQNVLKVGDTVADIREGRNAGVETVGIIEGSSLMSLSEDEYRALSDEERKDADNRVISAYHEAGATHIIRDIRGLIDLL